MNTEPLTPAVAELPRTPELAPGALAGSAHRGERISSMAVRAIWNDYVSIVAAQTALAALTLAGLALSARLLGPEDYGTVVMFMTVVQCLFIVGIKWSFPSVIRFGREALVREGSAGGVYGAWAPLVGGSFLLCSLGLLSGSALVMRLVGPHSPSLGAYLAVLLLTMVGIVTVQVLQVEGKMQVSAWAPVAGKLVLTLLLLWVSIGRAWAVTPSLVVACVAVGLLAQILLSLSFVGMPPPAFLMPDWGLTRRLVRYASPLWVGFLAAYLSEWVDLYFLRFYRGHADVGVYQISYQAFLFLAGGLAAMYTLLFPLLTAWVAEGAEGRLRQFVLRMIPQVSVLWGVLVLGLGTIQAPCFALVFGSAFAASGQWFSILLIASAFQPIVVLYGTLLLSHDRPVENTATIAIMAAVNVLGDLLLVPPLGALGAACSTAASFIVAAWLCLAWGNRSLRIDHRAALIPAGFVAVSLLAMAGRPLGIRLAVLLAATGGLFWWSRAAAIFSRDDLSILAQVHCPRWVTALTTKLYLVLSGERPGPISPQEVLER